MANYVSSNNIRMFPSAFRREVTSSETTTTYNPDSHLNTEYNLTNLSGRNTTTTGFVVSYDASTNEIEFCIMGYWFKSIISEVKVDGSPLYASIKLKSPASATIEDVYDRQLVNYTNSGQALENLDETDGTFTGVYFSTSAPSTTTNVYSIPLLDEDGNVPEASAIRLTTKNIADGSIKKSIDKQLTTNEVYTTDIKNNSSSGVSITSAAGSISISTPDDNQQGDVNITGADLSLKARGDLTTDSSSAEIKASDIKITNKTPTSTTIMIGDTREGLKASSKAIIGRGAINLLGSGATTTGRLNITGSSATLGYYSVGSTGLSGPRISMSEDTVSMSGALVSIDSPNTIFSGNNVSLSQVKTTLGETYLSKNILMTNAVDIGTSSNRVQNIYAENIDCETLTTQSSKSLYYRECFRWHIYLATLAASTWKSTTITLPYSYFPFTPETDAEKSYFLETATISFSVTAKGHDVDTVECTRTVPLKTFLDCTKTANLKESSGGPLSVEANTYHHDKGVYVASKENSTAEWGWNDTGLYFKVYYKQITYYTENEGIRISVKIL